MHPGEFQAGYSRTKGGGSSNILWPQLFAQEDWKTKGGVHLLALHKHLGDFRSVYNVCVVGGGSFPILKHPKFHLSEKLQSCKTKPQKHLLSQCREKSSQHAHILLPKFIWRQMWINRCSVFLKQIWWSRSAPETCPASINTDKPTVASTQPNYPPLLPNTRENCSLSPVKSLP